MTLLDTTRSIRVRGQPETGICGQTVPGAKISMRVVSLAPGEQFVPQHPPEAEVAAYIVHGRGRVYFGERLDDHVEVRPGDFFFVPERLPHTLRNSGHEPLKAVTSHSLDPNTRVPHATPTLPATVRVLHSVVEPGTTAQTRGMVRSPAICFDTVGATQIWMCQLAANPNGPSGSKGQAHHHGDAHTAAYTITGRGKIRWGKDLSEFIELEPGDFAFDPPGLVHAVDIPHEEGWWGVLSRCPDNTVVNLNE